LGYRISCYGPFPLGARFETYEGLLFRFPNVFEAAVNCG